MAEQQKAEADPSIEEILDSIRQIISEEDEGGEDAVMAEDDIIELTDKVEPEAAPKRADPDPVMADPPPAQSAPVEEPKPKPETPAAPVQAKPPETKMTPPPEDDMPAPSDESLTGILSKKAEDSVAGALAELTRRSEVQQGGGITIEDLVREEIRPLLRNWLDKYLPALVERLLQKELERISRRVESD